MHFLTLQNKDVINLSTGKKIGYVSDLILDDQCLRLEAIVVEAMPITKLIYFFKTPSPSVIPVCLIKSIGEDVILVDIDNL